MGAAVQSASNQPIFSCYPAEMHPGVQLKCGITRLAAGLTCQLQPCPAAQRAAHQLPQVLGSAVPPKPAHQPVGLVLHTAKRGREGRRHAGCGF